MSHRTRPTPFDRRRFHVHKALLTLLVGFVAVSSLAREALAQPLRTVAVIDVIKFPPKAKQAHEHMRAALEEALAPKSWFLAQTQPIVDCGGSVDCLAKVADATGTKYVLRLSGSRTSDDGYDVTLELYTSLTARIQRTGAYCDYCDLQRIDEVASKSAIDLLANALKEEAELRSAKREAQAPAPSAAPVPPSAATRPPAIVAPPPAVEPATRSWMPWTLIGAGVLTLGYGVWAISKNGDSTGGPSPGASSFTQDHYSSKARGWGCLVGGGVAAIAGVIWMRAAPSYTATVSTAPNHVALSVRF